MRAMSFIFCNFAPGFCNVTMNKKKQIAILGSTGSIGTQALEVIEEHADLYEVYCLTANNKVELLAQQAHQFKPALRRVAAADGRPS